MNAPERKIAILFVDDQEEVLAGLRRMARDMRQHWQAEFALGGEAALARLHAGHFDVLVTDMRMPGIDGSELLRRSVGIDPGLIRIVLSGQHETDDFIRQGWPAHQFLAKPCDPAELKGKIGQVIAMREPLENSRFKELVAQVDLLPAVPGIYLEIERELQREEASLRRVSEIVGRDPGMAAKVLQLANSPVFGHRRRVDSLDQAVCLLGCDTIKVLAAWLGVAGSMPLSKHFSAEQFSAHAMRVALLAAAIVEAEGGDTLLRNQTFLAGLLHEIGLLIVTSHFPDESLRARQRSRELAIPKWRIEKEIFGATHAEVGAYLVSLWGISAEIAATIAFHLQPARAEGRAPAAMLAAVHVADLLADGVRPGADDDGFDRSYLQSIDALARLPVWQALADTFEEKS